MVEKTDYIAVSDRHQGSGLRFKSSRRQQLLFVEIVDADHSGAKLLAGLVAAIILRAFRTGNDHFASTIEGGGAGFHALLTARVAKLKSEPSVRRWREIEN